MFFTFFAFVKQVQVEVVRQRTVPGVIRVTGGNIPVRTPERQLLLFFFLSEGGHFGQICTRFPRIFNSPENFSFFLFKKNLSPIHHSPMESQDDSMEIDDELSIPAVAQQADVASDEGEEKSGKKRPGAAYHWCFTLNNPKTGVDGAKFLEQVTDPDEGWGVEYLVFQLEKGVKEKTPHYQGYCEFTKAERLTSIKKKGFGAALAHWEKRKGTPAQARDYCMKAAGKISLTFIYHAGLEPLDMAADAYFGHGGEVDDPSYGHHPGDAIRHGYERRWPQVDVEQDQSEQGVSFDSDLEDGYATPPTV